MPAKQSVNIGRKRLLAIIEAASLKPEPYEFSYGIGATERCVSVNRPTRLKPQLGLLVDLVRACRSREEAALLISMAELRETASEVMVFWRGSEWNDED